MTRHDVSRALGKHYTRKFAEHGQRPEGVDWGTDASDHWLRLDRMLALCKCGQSAAGVPSILDVGCGYGSLLQEIKRRARAFDYHGIDLCEPMIIAARENHPEARWDVRDALALPAEPRYDYVVCNGVLTQKLDASIKDMNAFAHALVRHMFSMCRIGVAFNVMTTHVNFTAPNLYYRNPAELLAWCMSELTSRVALDHAYPLFEYTLYLYREDAPGLAYGAHRQGTTPA
jgi:SAM-dependent methyltransferase